MSKAYRMVVEIEFTMEDEEGNMVPFEPTAEERESYKQDAERGLDKVGIAVTYITWQDECGNILEEEK